MAGPVVGVHGIAQQQVGRNQLREPWRLALADGLERATGHAPATPPPLDIAFYGDLFLTDADTGAATKSVAAEADSVLAGLEQSEVDDLCSAAAEAVSERDLANASEQPAKGYTRVPVPLQRALAALDRRFGAAAGVLYLGELRQVRRYLCSPELKAAVDDRVDAAITDECRIVVAHSLGSVVAFEYLRRNPQRRMDLLLTLGSPLGLRMVRTRLPDPAHGAADGKLPSTGAWVNLRDPRDPVACAGGLARWWPRVRDVEVNNQADAHSVARYLSKRAAGVAILDVAPELAFDA
ncbi:hypothetical protein [Nocardia sp. CA-119907]|uniref:hypothetical protein n=1 Tax=Nocardia sp. CA-119907 TaxID=3239973 RepID=UPI003D9813A0